MISSNHLSEFLAIQIPLGFGMVYKSSWRLIVSKHIFSDVVSDIVGSEVDLRVLVVNKPESFVLVNETVVLLDVVVTEYLSVKHFLSDKFSTNLFFHKVKVLNDSVKVV
jgi:hypothetical protein